MSHLRIIVYEVEGEGAEAAMTEVQRVDMAPMDFDALRAETTLDGLEARAVAVGRQVMRTLVERQWEAVDSEAASRHVRLSPPAADPS